MGEIKYSTNSEIDKAFPYLNSLNEQLKEKKKGYYEEKSSEVTIKKLIKYYFSNNKITKINNADCQRKYIKSKSFFKDGYTFHIRFNSFINNDPLNNCEMFEIYVNIKYDKEKIEKQLYTLTDDRTKAFDKFYDLMGMFKYLTRRDIIEMIIKDSNEKLKH